MRQVIGVLGSLGLGLMLAAAGLAFDKATLFYLGLAVFALMAAQWLVIWARSARPTPATPTALVGTDEPAPTDLDKDGKTLLALRRARDNAVVAIAQGNSRSQARAFNEIEAALLSCKREFGIGPLKITSKTRDSVPYKPVLEAYVTFLDEIYPLLREGHVAEAQARNKSWKWPR
jgi:hypothetical protein